MGFEATDKGGKQFPICPAGAHIARCYMMIDLGTQPAFGKEKNPTRKIRIGFETPEEKTVFIEQKGEEPFTLSKKYTLSTNEKSNLRKDLESWRGRPFTEEEAKKFDVSRVLGAAAVINVIHKEKQGGGKTAIIASIAPLMKGQKCPDKISAPLIYDMQNPDPGVFNVLPKWVQEEIQSALEFKGNPTTQGADATPHDDQEEGDPF